MPERNRSDRNWLRRDALRSVAEYSTRIVLIDGPALAELMIDHGVGVTVTTTYNLKRLDSDFFDEGYNDA